LVWFLSSDGSPSTRKTGKVLLLLSCSNLLHCCNSVQWNFLLAGFDGKEESLILYGVIFPILNAELKLLESQVFRMKQGTYSQSFRWKSDYKMLLLMQNRVSVMSKHFDGYGNATHDSYKVAGASLETNLTSMFRVRTHEERVSLGEAACAGCCKGQSLTGRVNNPNEIVQDLGEIPRTERSTPFVLFRSDCPRCTSLEHPSNNAPSH
jgi:hypothetical protein